MEIYLLLMIFIHIVVDFLAQGCLADLKQKVNWESLCSIYNLDIKKYKYDYIVALIAHSFMWSFAIVIPYLVTPGINDSALVIKVVFCNTVAHAIFDELKCNDYYLNLWQDQLLHLFQIIATWNALF